MKSYENEIKHGFNVKLTDAYFENQYRLDVADIYASNLSEFLTIAEADSLIADFEIPEVKRALIKGKEVCKKWNIVNGHEFFEPFL